MKDKGLPCTVDPKRAPKRSPNCPTPKTSWNQFSSLCKPPWLWGDHANLLCIVPSVYQMYRQYMQYSISRTNSLLSLIGVYLAGYNHVERWLQCGACCLLPTHSLKCQPVLSGHAVAYIQVLRGHPITFATWGGSNTRGGD